MAVVWSPADAGEALEAVREALAGDSTLALAGAGSRRAFGRPVDAAVHLDLSALRGIGAYQPQELVVTVAPGTPLTELEAVLAENQQQLAFEPPDFSGLWGGQPGQGTVGGMLLTGRGGPRRLTAGAPRDHCLGLKGVNGFGESFAAGGRVVKNVTGFDLTKLVAGSFGTLCVVTELTFKVLPAAPDAITLVLLGLDDEAAVAAMSRALGSPTAVSAAAHLPADATPGGVAETLVRLEGITPSIRARGAHLADVLKDVAPIEILDRESSVALWRKVTNASVFADDLHSVVWKLSVAPSAAPAIAAQLGGRRFYDWGGGGLWLELPAAPDAHEFSVRRALAAAGGDGHATLMRAPDTVRAAVPPFQPLAPALAALSHRVKQKFDPCGLFNPGRMYESR